MRFLPAILLLLFAAPAHAQDMQRAVVVSTCGSQALPAGPLTTLTMNPQGQLCLTGIGGGGPVPVNSVAPVASGLLPVGSTLSCTTGTWTNSPTSFGYQWLRAGAAISGATSATYVTVTADGGTSVGCQVRAFNAGGGSAFVASNTLAITAGGSSSTWSATDAAANSITLSNGNLTINPPYPGSGWASIRGTTSFSSGKKYVEFKFVSGSSVGGNLGIGLADATFVPTSYLSSSGNSVGFFGNSTAGATPGFTTQYSISSAPVVGDVWAEAIDFTGGKFWIARNNVWQNTSDPVAGTFPILTIASPALGLSYFPALTISASSGANTTVWTLQPTAASQTYTPPSGFSAWN